MPTPDPVARVAAERTVLTHVNEFVLGEPTAAIRATIEDEGYHLATDFETYVVE